MRPSQLGHLLIAAIRLLDAITRGDDSLAEIWCGVDLLDAVLIAQHQMKWMHGNEVEIIHRLFYTFSSNVTGVGALIKSFDRLLPTFGIYLRKVCEDEPHLIPFNAYYNSLRAIIPVMDAVLASLPDAEASSCFASDIEVLPCLVYITLGCQKQLRELALIRGILADLSVLFKNVLRSVASTLCETPTDDLTALGSWLTQDLRWLTDLDKRTDFQTRREAFINCCLHDNTTETRGHLLLICNRLHLSILLETLTDVC